MGFSIGIAFPDWDRGYDLLAYSWDSCRDLPAECGRGIRGVLSRVI